MKISLVHQKETQKELLVVLMDDSGIVLRAFISTIFKQSSVDEIKIVFEGACGKIYKSSDKPIVLDDVFHRIMKSMHLEEIDASCVSTIKGGTEFAVKHVKWK